MQAESEGLWRFYIDGIEVPRESVGCQAMNFGQKPRSPHLIPKKLIIRSTTPAALQRPVRLVEEYLRETLKDGDADEGDLTRVWSRLGCPDAAALAQIEPELFCAFVKDLDIEVLDTVTSAGVRPWMVNRIDTVRLENGALTLEGIAY